MATFAKRAFSGSTNGRGIKVVATATPGTTIHTAVTGTSDYDELWLYATNDGTSATELTIEWGGTTDPDDLIQMSIPAKSGLYLIVPGNVLQNSLVVRAFSNNANEITIFGFVNRISA